MLNKTNIKHASVPEIWR